MMNVTYQCELIPDPEETLGPDEVARIIEETTDEIIELGFDDVTIGGSLLQRKFNLDLYVSTDDYLDEFQSLDFPKLMAAVDSAVRAAFHKAGVSTPGWAPLHNAPRLERRKITFDEHYVSA